MKIDILRQSNKPPKYIYVRTASDTAKYNFRIDLSETDIASIIRSDPNCEYAKFEGIITTAYEKYFLEIRVNFNKHKHTLSKLSMDSPDYELMKYNLKIYNRYHNQCIRNVKKDCYACEFTKYKGDIRKTWDTVRTS